jgi:integrase
VFTRALVTRLAGTQLRAKFEWILQDAGLPTIPVADLRHSCAELGHSRVSTTLAVYSHRLPAQKHDAVTAAWAAL